MFQSGGLANAKYDINVNNFYSFTIPTATPFLARLKAGPILKHIYTHLAEAVTDTTGKHRKLLIYSGHDITVGNVLHAMGLYDGNCPCYTSAVFFELIMGNTYKFLIVEP